MNPAESCPECRAGKHANCPGFAFDEADVEIPCPCGERNHQ